MAEGLLKRVAHWAAERGDSVAIVGPGEHLCYRELDRRSRCLAAQLIRAGVRPGDRVGLHWDRSVEFVVTVLGTLYAEATYVPLGTDWPAERISFLAEDAGLRLILTRDPTSSALAGVRCPVVQPVVQEGDEEPDGLPLATQGSLAAAYVMFTSGSTGQPKGVVVPQRAILRLCTSDYLPWGPDLRFLLLAPTSFDASTFELWGPLLHGGTCVIHPEPRVTLEGLRRTLREHSIDCLWLTAGLFNQVIDEDPTLLSPVRYVLTGGEALSVPHVRRALVQLPDTILINGYGPTEATTFTCTYRIPRDEALGASVPIGKPLARTVCRILDEQRRPVPAGTPGELYIGGEGLADGYLNRLELTADRFVPDPCSSDPDARLYRSGDRVRELPDGNLEFLGRLDDQLKIRGFRIEPGEVESVLSALPGIQRAAVTARTGSDGVRELAAYLVLAPEAALSSSFLRAELSQRLPAFLVPEFFGVVDSLPLTANGKVDRGRLADGAVREIPAASCGPAEPRTPMESELVALWSRELGRESVGIQDRFVDLGGNSLRAMRLVARIRERWGPSLKLSEFLECQTVAALAERVSASQGAVYLEPIRPVSRDHPMPLTGEQMGLWYLHQQGPDPAAYHVAFAWRLRGPLDEVRFEWAWREVVKRHEALRMRVVLVGEIPHQVADADLEWKWTWIEAHPGRSEEASLTATLRDVVRAPFDLGRAPLWRCVGIHGPGIDPVLVLVLHHILIDEWSLRVLLDELAGLYASGPGSESELQRPALQFGDFAAWHLRRLDDDSGRAAIGYWRDTLQGAPAALELPFDRRPEGPSSGAGRRVVFPIPAPIRQAVERLAQRAGTTAFVAGLAAFQALLARWTGEEEMVIGTPLAQREEPGLERMVGYCLNSLPIRLHVDPAQTVMSAVRKVHTAVQGAFQHGFIPLDRIVRAADAVRRDTAVPLFNVMFVLLDEPWPQLRLSGLVAEPLELETETSKVDLTLFLTRGVAGGWRAELEYAADRFSPSAAVALAGQVGTFFASFATNPDRAVADAELLTSDDAQALVDELSPPVHPEPLTSYDAAFAATVRETPERVALEVGPRHWTYAELDQVVTRIAAGLRQAGVRDDDRVALLVPRDENLLMSILGILRAGAGYVPLDPEAPRERLGSLLTEARPRCLLVTQKTASLVPSTEIAILDVEELRNRSVSGVAAPVETSLDRLAYLIFTSGSTGRPKGVEVEQRQMMSLFRAMERILAPDRDVRWLATTNYTFDISVYELLCPLMHGQSVVLFRGDAADETIPRLLTRAGITHFQCTPSRAQALMLDPEGPAALGGLQAFISTGEPLPTDLAMQLTAVLRGPLLDLYGPTETTIWSTGAVLSGEGSDVHIGRPMSNTRVAVVDDQLRPVPPGIVGELLIGGLGVARGYWNQPELTAERFVHPTFAESPDERWYRTGDRVRWRSDGNLDYLGRRDFQVKLRGYRIELGEIESALRTHPSVRQAVVVLRKEAQRDGELVGYLVASEAGRVDVGVIRQFLAERLSPWLIPTRWVWLDQMPLTPSGKVNRKALPAPEWETAVATPALERPQSETESALAGLWQELLGRPVTGIHDDFFALGGHSLLALRLVAALRARFHQPVTLADLLAHPTIAGLAQYLDGSARRDGAGPAIAFRGRGSGAPFFHVPGLFGYEFLAPEVGRILGSHRRYFDALQFPGVDGRSTPLQRVEDLADDVIRQINALYPVGPVWLTGSSFGGLVAVEVAQRLTASGRPVEGLILFDSVLGEGGRRRSHPEFVMEVLRRIVRQKPGHRLAFARRMIGNKFGIGRWQGSATEEAGAGKRTQEIQAIIDANYRAAASYVPRPYRGRVILFQATIIYDHMYLRNAPDPRNGWGSVFQGDFQIVPFDCQHHELFQEPVHPEVCRRLDRFLNELERPFR